MFNAELILLIGGVFVFCLTLFMVTRREMREKYALGWMCIATTILLIGIFPNVIFELSGWLRLDQKSLVLGFFIALVYFFSFTVTISLSRLYRRSVQLAQEVSILEERLRKLEECQADDSAGE